MPCNSAKSDWRPSQQSHKNLKTTTGLVVIPASVSTSCEDDMDNTTLPCNTALGTRYSVTTDTSPPSEVTKKRM